MWVNVTAFALVAVIAFIESKRGFGRAMFDAVGAILSLKFALLLAPVVAGKWGLLADPRYNLAAWHAVAFIVFAGLAVLGSKVLYDYTLLSLDVFDPILGALFGLVSGVCAANLLVRGLLMAYGHTPMAEMIRQTFAAQELVKFRAYHIVLNALYGLGQW